MKPTWLEVEDLPDPPRPNLPLERMQEEAMKAAIGWELNLYLQWNILKEGE